MAPGCKPGGLTPYVGSNPTPCTRFDFRSQMLRFGSRKASGCSSVGRASAFQAEGREFESRRPLQKSKAEVGRMKDEKRTVASSAGSSFRLHCFILELARVAQG